VSADRALIYRAAAVLEKGPIHTVALAHEVLGLSGNPGAASAAVFTLLGSDARFLVDNEGVWSMAGPGPGTPLADLRYAVVDVETTGGTYGGGHRMTEIAIYEVRGGVVEDEYRSLVNPGRAIPYRIEMLTGIDNRMVSSAPFFDQIAIDVFDRLDGRVFVAHNVRFDWGWVSRQLAEAIGDVPSVERLCTVQMARRLLPRLRRRNLDAVARHYGIDVGDRHRAHGDALATARILIRLLDEASRQGLCDLHALRIFLQKREKRSRPRQGQQLSLLGSAPDPNTPGAPD
jgi:DNA polymerase III epsilon subunit family exonuclease